MEKFKYAIAVLRQKIIKRQKQINTNPGHWQENTWKAQIEDLESAIAKLQEK